MRKQSDGFLRIKDSSLYLFIFGVTNLVHCAINLSSRNLKDTSKSKFAIAECAKLLCINTIKNF